MAKEVTEIKSLPDTKEITQVYLHDEVSWGGVLSPTKHLHRDGTKYKNIKAMGLTKDKDLILEAGLDHYALVPSHNVKLALIPKK